MGLGWSDFLTNLDSKDFQKNSEAILINDIGLTDINVLSLNQT